MASHLVSLMRYAIGEANTWKGRQWNCSPVARNSSTFREPFLHVFLGVNLWISRRRRGLLLSNIRSAGKRLGLAAFDIHLDKSGDRMRAREVIQRYRLFKKSVLGLT